MRIFDYRLGARSALDWIIDQHQIKGDSDPNREDDPGYIVRLIGQVWRISIETQRIVQTLPPFRSRPANRQACEGRDKQATISAAPIGSGAKSDPGKKPEREARICAERQPATPLTRRRVPRSPTFKVFWLLLFPVIADFQIFFSLKPTIYRHSLL